MKGRAFKKDDEEQDDEQERFYGFSMHSKIFSRYMS